MHHVWFFTSLSFCMVMMVKFINTAMDMRTFHFVILSTEENTFFNS